MNYGDLQTQFQNLLNRRDCTPSQAQAFIQMAIPRIQRELRTPHLEKSISITIPNPYVGLVIPADYIELIDLIPLSTRAGLGTTSMQRMEKCDISRANVLALNAGIPAQYSRDGLVWVLGPSPVPGDVIKVRYYGFLGALTLAADTNTISIAAPDLITYCSLSYAGDFYTDKRVAGWEGRYGQIRDDLQMAADDDEEHGAAAVQPAFAYPSDMGGDYPYVFNQ